MTEASPSLGDAAVQGARWFALSRIPAEVGGLVVAVILAHLLTPTEFGQAAVANAVAVIAVILSFEGFGTYLVQRRDDDQRRLSTALGMSLVFGLVATIVVIALALTLGRLLFGREIADLVALVAPTFLLASATAPSRSILQRRLNFRALAIVEVAPQLVQFAVSIALAAIGVGAASIVVGALAFAFFALVLFLAFAPPPPPTLHREYIREALRFGVPAAFSGLTYTLRQNIAYLVLAAVSGPSVTGLFWRAFQVGGQYQGKITGIIQRMMFPLMARSRDAAHLRSIRERVVRANAIITAPLLAIFVIVAPEVFPAVFGQRWDAAVLPAQILAFVGFANAVTNGTEALPLATGQPGRLLVFNLIFVSSYGVVIALVAPSGLTAIAIAAAAVHLCMLVVAQWLLVTGTIGLPVRSLVRDLAPAVVAGAATLAAGGACAWALRAEDAPGVVVVLVGGVAGSLAYAVALRVAFPLHGAIWRRSGPASCASRDAPDAPYVRPRGGGCASYIRPNAVRFDPPRARHTSRQVPCLVLARSCPPCCSRLSSRSRRPPVPRRSTSRPAAPTALRAPRKPFRTVGKALTTADAGDAIKLAGGTYPSFETSRMFARPVTISPLGSARAVVAGASFLGAQRIVSDGISYSGQVAVGSHPVRRRAQLARNIAISGGEVDPDNRSLDCVTLRNASTVRIERMRLNGCSTGISGSYLGTDAARITIARNVIEHVNADGIHFGSWSDVEIADNVIRDMDDPAGIEHNDGIQIWGNAHRVSVARNRISDSAAQLLLIQAANAGDNSDIAVTDNVLFDSGAIAVQVQASARVSFVGNTVWRARYGSFLARPGGPRGDIAPVGLVVANNALETFTLQNATATTAGNFVGRPAGARTTVDPGFADAAAGNFDLRPTSILKGAGASAFRTRSDVDRRVRRATPSVGAFE